MRARGVQPLARGGLGAGQQDGGRAVDHAGAVAGVVDVLDLQVGVAGQHHRAQRGALVVERHVGHRGERRGELGEALERRVRAGELLVVEGEGAVLAVDGHEAAVEAALGDRPCGALLRHERQLVERLAGMPSSVAIASAATPWWVCGWRARRRRLPASISGPRTPIWASPSAGCSDIISQPPAMTTSSMPAMIDAGGEVGRGDARAAEAVERDAATPWCRSRRRAAAMRPRSPPCVPTCMLVPKMTSSTAAVSRSLRSRIAASTVAPSCCGWMSASAPLPTLPMPRGVRHASMIQASFMYIHLREVTKRLSSS